MLEAITLKQTAIELCPLSASIQHIMGSCYVVTHENKVSQYKS